MSAIGCLESKVPVAAPRCEADALSPPGLNVAGDKSILLPNCTFFRHFMILDCWLLSYSKLNNCILLQDRHQGPSLCQNNGLKAYDAGIWGSNFAGTKEAWGLALAWMKGQDTTLESFTTNSVISKPEHLGTIFSDQSKSSCTSAIMIAKTFQRTFPTPQNCLSQQRLSSWRLFEAWITMVRDDETPLLVKGAFPWTLC